ncbi:hypothetical protein [Capnocytophaga canimorsus]|uniref:hypothetical protein n=1 Tax=Capnocytophaga canimorsus TaxID=28188 RepID=UPI0028E571CB|nr:hypothetical protein [Capnocytophaga canimorsus]MDT9499133.1 hypothetical protein [Capnocytophaga canimorsus]
MKRLLRFLISIILWLVAVGLIFPLTIINFLLVWNTHGTPRGYFLSTATSLDRWGNREFRTLWNSTLIKTNSEHHFGDVRETISSVLGKNQITETLTLTGRILAGILDLLDKNHCQKSIAYY